MKRWCMFGSESGFADWSVIRSDGRLGNFLQSDHGQASIFCQSLFVLKNWISIKQFFKHSVWRCSRGDGRSTGAGHGTAGHTSVVAGHDGELRFDFGHCEAGTEWFRNFIFSVYNRIHNRDRVGQQIRNIWYWYFWVYHKYVGERMRKKSYI